MTIFKELFVLLHGVLLGLGSSHLLPMFAYQGSRKTQVLVKTGNNIVPVLQLRSLSSKSDWIRIMASASFICLWIGNPSQCDCLLLILGRQIVIFGGSSFLLYCWFMEISILHRFHNVFAIISSVICGPKRAASGEFQKQHEGVIWMQVSLNGLGNLKQALFSWLPARILVEDVLMLQGAAA